MNVELKFSHYGWNRTTGIFINVSLNFMSDKNNIQMMRDWI